MKKANWKTTLISLIIAVLFLVLAFYKTSFCDLWDAIRLVPGYWLGILGFGALLGTLVRGVRWWFMLPEPRQWREMGVVQRAIGMCYAANNFIPRSGEIIRILVVKRETQRSAAVISSTVILDRFFLDLLGLIGMFGLAFTINAPLLISLYENAEEALVFLLILAVCALSGLMMLALKPNWCLNFMKLFRLHLFPNFFAKIEHLTQELSLGMSSIKRVGIFSWILVQTALIWTIYLAVFYLGLQAFNISATLPEATLAFSLSMLGIIFPSPGGIGTYHFFTKVALVHVFGIGENEALGVATLLHAVMFLINSFYGLVCFLWSVRSTKESISTELHNL